MADALGDQCSAHHSALFCDGFENGLAAWEMSLPTWSVRVWFYVPGTVTLGHANLFNINEYSSGPGITAYSASELLSLYNMTRATSATRSTVHRFRSVDTKPVAGWDAVLVGIPFTGLLQTSAATVYIDDVVVDTGPIGCLP